MPKLSWNETRDRAIRFSHEWSDARHEERDKQTFWNEFFDIFGIPRKSVAVFEHAVSNVRGTYGFLDLFWPGVLLVEQKSAGASLAKAQSQAFAYLSDLASQGQHDELPRYVILCDFARFALYDLEPEDQKDLPLFDDGRPFRLTEFELSDLHRHIREFAFMRGEKTVRTDPEDPANLKATQLLADLHDALEATGYRGHALERYLVRLLFCLFAEDTGIFDAPGMFMALVEGSREDGLDLGPLLSQLWDVLKTDVPDRQTNLDEDLAAFPYVNGGLFSEPLPICSFNHDLRNVLLACARFHWARISPAVFGSLFQGIMDGKTRRQIGAHYTSERDILKVIRSLFLDDLRENLNAILADRSTRRIERLKYFQIKLRALRFFDPACGCGNFLILAYREMRRLENETLVALYGWENQGLLDVRKEALVDVDQFFGIEIGEWPARIAEVGLWLTDHQCNLELAEALGKSFRRLPLRAAPTIHIGNALRTDWHEVLPPTDDVVVFGNPPFVGHQWRNADQQGDVETVWGSDGRFGRLDYVTCWYCKAADYIQDTRIRCAFVSTNSITQGEQVGILWSDLFGRGIKIHFAHRTFSWASEARGKAHVHVVIIGFGNGDTDSKHIFDYDADPTGENPTVSSCWNISPYLIEGPDLVLPSRTNSPEGLPQMKKGSQPTDGGFLILDESARTSLVAAEPAAVHWLRPFIGGEELLNGGKRWALWLKDSDPAQLRASPMVRERLAGVRETRLKSPTKSVREFADRPALFTQDRQPESSYLAVPEVSSENRRYIPIAFLSAEVIASNKLQILVGGTVFHFGILSSAMHMVWVRTISGRLESRISYAPSVYNNFPWPAEVSERDRTAVEACAQAVLDARAQFPSSTLADLYDPLTMPAPLAKAHAALDRAVDRCYRRAPFASDRERVEHLFSLYERLATPLLPAKPKRRRA